MDLLQGGGHPYWCLPNSGLYYKHCRLLNGDNANGTVGEDNKF